MINYCPPHDKFPSVLIIALSQIDVRQSYKVMMNRCTGAYTQFIVTITGFLIRNVLLEIYFWASCGANMFQSRTIRTSHLLRLSGPVILKLRKSSVSYSTYNTFPQQNQRFVMKFDMGCYTWFYIRIYIIYKIMCIVQPEAYFRPWGSMNLSYSKKAT